MRHCDLISGLGRLKHAAAELREAWLAAKSHWTDQVSRDFEKNHLQHLPVEITLAVAAVQELATCWNRPRRNWKIPSQPSDRTVIMQNAFVDRQRKALADLAQLVAQAPPAKKTSTSGTRLARRRFWHSTRPSASS